jgi:hypothetical protein
MEHTSWRWEHMTWTLAEGLEVVDIVCSGEYFPRKLRGVCTVVQKTNAMNARPCTAVSDSCFQGWFGLEDIPRWLNLR